MDQIQPRSDAPPVGLRPLLMRWERLRLVYNAILAAVVLALLLRTPSLFDDPRLPAYLLKRALAANVCFTAGPAADAYISYVAGRRVPLTWILFLGGTLLSVLLAMSSIASFVSINL